MIVADELILVEEMMLNGNTGARIKELRTKKGLTQEGLAEATGLHRVTIARYESEGRNMTLDSASRIAQALGVSIDSLGHKQGGHDNGNDQERTAGHPAHPD